MHKNITAVLAVVLVAGCSPTPMYGPQIQLQAAPPMNAGRLINEQDCAKPIDTGGGNLMCIELTPAERRAKAEEEARLAREKREAAERAERARLEKERADQLAREEAARKAQLAEQERLAAERRRLEAEAAAAAAAAAAAERARQEKLAAEAAARERAEREAREKAALECRRLEQQRADGRAMLENFVATYGKVDEFTEISGQISAFLAKPRKTKPCPPA